MVEKRFRDVESDTTMRQRYLDDHKGLAPDNFIESQEGGGLDLAERRPTSFDEVETCAQGLDARIRRLSDAFDRDEELRY